MNRLFTLLITLTALAAAVAANAEPERAAPSKTFAITDEMLGARHPPMKLTKRAEDEAYGYTSDMPVVIGGGFANGKEATYSYLNALIGPEGQKIHYKRLGTCCFFKTPNALFGDTAPLEFFEITYDGLAEPKQLYFNWYDPSDPLIPVGLNAVEPDAPQPK